MSFANEPSTDDALQSTRGRIRQLLNEITSDFNSALIDARLVCPVYVAVPSTGALLTIVCPLDPDDHECDRITMIACEIVEKAIGATQLVTNPIPCAWGAQRWRGWKLSGD